MTVWVIKRKLTAKKVIVLFISLDLGRGGKNYDFSMVDEPG